jgi:hypothetical protein
MGANSRSPFQQETVRRSTPRVVPLGFMQGLKAASIAAAVSLLGCGLAGTPRAQDAPAPRDFYAQLKPDDPPACRRPVRVFEPSASLPGYQVMSSMSVTCSPGALDVCERRLRARACELQADAVILEEASGPAGVPPGASSQSLVTRGGRAIRWK